jgi:hypothetical protein
MMQHGYELNEPLLLLHPQVEFRTPVTGGTSSGSDYARIELKESMTWDLLSPAMHTLSLSGAVTEMALLNRPRISIMQVKASNMEVLMIRIHFDPANPSKAKVWAWYDLGSCSDCKTFVSLGDYELGQPYNFTVAAGNGMVTVTYNGKTFAPHPFTRYAGTSTLSQCHFKVSMRAGGTPRSLCPPCSAHHLANVPLPSCPPLSCRLETTCKATRPSTLLDMPR